MSLTGLKGTGWETTSDHLPSHLNQMFEPHSPTQENTSSTVILQVRIKSHQYLDQKFQNFYAFLASEIQNFPNDAMLITAMETKHFLAALGEWKTGMLYQK